ncbi:hypothetical protein [Novosphingobium gossypii]|uniref:hypothetical protein n=1 Tax=Novosphingobium gossypii TaxID=1604774 RepID=UPI003D1D9478
MTQPLAVQRDWGRRKAGALLSRLCLLGRRCLGDLGFPCLVGNHALDCVVGPLFGAAPARVSCRGLLLHLLSSNRVCSLTVQPRVPHPDRRAEECSQAQRYADPRSELSGRLTSTTAAAKDNPVYVTAAGTITNVANGNTAAAGWKFDDTIAAADFDTETFVTHPQAREGLWSISDDTTPKWQRDVSFTLTQPSPSGGGHLQAIAYAIQKRAITENVNAGPDGAGFRSDDQAYTLEARTVPQAVAYPINPNALRDDSHAITPSPDASGRVRLRDPGLGVGADGDPADTLQAAGPAPSPIP